MPSAVDDPTCHDCIIARAIRAQRDEAITERDAAEAEVIRLKRLAEHGAERYARRAAAS